MITSIFPGHRLEELRERPTANVTQIAPAVSEAKALLPCRQERQGSQRGLKTLALQWPPLCGTNPSAQVLSTPEPLFLFKHFDSELNSSRHKLLWGEMKHCKVRADTSARTLESSQNMLFLLLYAYVHNLIIAVNFSNKRAFSVQCLTFHS